MAYKTQCEVIKVCRRDISAFSLISHFLLLGDVSSSYNFQDPKEKARLEFYFDLLEKYKYSVGRIEFDVAVPSEYSARLADIVVFKDNERKIPYIVAECCKDRISDSAFDIRVKAAIDKAEALSAEFAVCVTRARRRMIKLNYINGVAYAKTVCDLPVLYGMGE